METLPRVSLPDSAWSERPAIVRVAAAERFAGARLASLERLRLLAIFEIVAFHIRVEERLPIVGGLGLPLFLVLAAAFSAVAAERRSAREVAHVKLKRIGVAWLFWCAVYGAHDLLFALHQGRPISAVFEPAMLFYGPTVHLWFAPFAIFAGSVAAIALERTRTASPALRLSAALAIGVAAVPLLAPWSRSAVPLAQWSFALPSIFLGLALGLVMLSPRATQWRGALAAAALLLFALVIGPRFDAPAAESLRRYALVFGSVVAALAIPGRFDFVTRRFAPYTLGVYFVHVLVHDIGCALLAPSFTSRLSDGETILASLLVYGVSLAVVALLSRTPLHRFVRVGSR